MASSTGPITLSLDTSLLEHDDVNIYKTIDSILILMKDLQKFRSLMFNTIDSVKSIDEDLLKVKSLIPLILLKFSKIYRSWIFSPTYSAKILDDLPKLESIIPEAQSQFFTEVI